MKRNSQRPEDARDVCKQGKNYEAAKCKEENTGHRTSEENDPLLKPIHKIFLSHSGAQKEFVGHLCEALERRGHYPFFDKCSRSLSKGERFPELILKAAQQCQIAVVVVSKEYFMSKWPMIELHAVVQALKKKANTKLKVLPLFYGLSVSEFRDENIRERWFKQWKTWAKNDAQGRIKVNEWKDALDVLGSFNGISYNRELQEIVAYQNDIVSNICSTILPDIKWDDSHLQGNSSICEVIHEKIQEIGPSQKYELKVVGIYGVGGIGKTTICKALCIDMSGEYNGRVCHIEFKSKSSSLKNQLQKVLINLTNISQEDLRSFNEGELDRLKESGLLQDVDLELGTVSMHDLYRDFAKLEVKGKLDGSIDLENRRWVYVDNGGLSELESTPSGRCWQKLVRLGIHQEDDSPPSNPIESLEGMKWQYFANVVVLKLVGLKWVRGALNVQRLNCLRSLELDGVVGLDRLEGLEELKNLTYFKWWQYRYGMLWDEEVKDCHTHIVGQFPASLEVLQIGVGVWLGPDVLARCSTLCKLVLQDIRADNLDLSNCSSLQSLTLEHVRNLRNLLGLSARGPGAPRLQFLEISGCEDLVNIPGLDHLISLERLVIEFCKFEVPDLQNLTKLQVLRLPVEKVSNGKVRLKDGSGPSIPQQLRELRYCNCKWSWKSTAPNLSGFEQLQVLDLSFAKNLTFLEGLGDLPALRCLDLSYCTVSSRLPDLSKSTNLKELILVCCEVELHEEDIRMLASLPLLQPVPIGYLFTGVRLDLVRRKVLKYLTNEIWSLQSWLDWKEHEWEESDLGFPPIRIGRSGSLVESEASNHILGPELRSRSIYSVKVLVENGCIIAGRRFPPVYRAVIKEEKLEEVLEPR